MPSAFPKSRNPRKPSPIKIILRMKRALVISGGGSKGAFAVGILQQLKALFPLLTFDAVVGTSTGALISPLAATEELNELQRIYTSVTTDQIVTRHRIGDRLNEKSIYTVEKLYQLLKNTLTEARYQKIKASGKAVYAVTTCLQTEDIVVYTTADAPIASPLYKIKTVKDAEHLRLAILASACQPVLMTPVKVDMNTEAGAEKNFQYVDGGVREYAGVQMAIDQGATEVFCILLSDGKGEVAKTEFTDLFSILMRTMSIMIQDVQKNDVVLPQQYEAALAYIAAVKAKMKTDGVPEQKIDAYFKIGNSGATPFEVERGVRVFFIYPDGPLGGGPGGLVFDPQEMQGMVARGRTAASDFVAKLDKDEQTWLA